MVQPKDAVVYVLWHSLELDGHDEDKMIGVYSTKAKASGAMRRYRKLKGFRDYPDGFIIDPYRLNQDHWAEGFVTVPL